MERSASLRRRRALLRMTAQPTFFVRVNPQRGARSGASQSSRRPACRLTALPCQRRPLPARTKSARRLSRPIGSALPGLRIAQPFANTWQRRGRHHHRYADNRLRPRARRAAITLRPPTVSMRARKPWRRLRTIFEGWYVRFTDQTPSRPARGAQSQQASREPCADLLILTDRATMPRPYPPVSAVL